MTIQPTYQENPNLDLGPHGYVETMMVILNAPASADLIEQTGQDISDDEGMNLVVVAKDPNGRSASLVIPMSPEDARGYPKGISAQIHFRRDLPFGMGEPLAISGSILVKGSGKDALHSAADDLAKDIGKTLSIVRRRLGEYEERKARSERIALRDPELITDEDRAREVEDIDCCKEHLAALERKLEALKVRPGSMFMPLGTIVRFNDAPVYRRGGTVVDVSPGKSYPVPGSIGVVTGLKHTGELPIAVSLRRPFTTGWKDSYVPSEDRVPTFFVDPEKVDVIGYATFPDGNECHSYGFVPTHIGSDDIMTKEPSDEMILFADGFYWRLHDFGGTQSVEALQAYDRIEEYSWLRGVHEQFENTPPSTPSP